MCNTPIHLLRICQLNVGKSLDSQSELLNSISPQDYDLILIQEPYLDRFKNSRATPHWSVVYPTRHLHDNSARSRAIILVNKNLSTNAWSPIDNDSPDIVALQLTANIGQVFIFNVYNDQTHHRSVHELTNAARRLGMEVHPDTPTPGHLIWAGDFNRHCPIWEPPANQQLLTTAYLDQAEPLLNALAALDMRMALPPFLPTHHANGTGTLTRPDNVFMSMELEDALVSCDVDPTRQPIKTNHYPIFAVFNLDIDRVEPVPRRNFTKVNWEDFTTLLKDNLSAASLMKGELSSKEDMQANLRKLTHTLAETIDHQVPITKPLPFTKRWWNKDLENKRKQKQAQSRQAQCMKDYPNHPIHAQYTTTRNSYKDDIKKAKLACWEKWLDDADPSSIWNIGKYIRSGPSDGGKSRIPPISSTDQDGFPTTLKDNEAKSKVFHKTFFPLPQQAMQIPANFPYPPPAFICPSISDSSIHEAITNLKEHKASGPDMIPNEVFLHCRNELIPFLGPIYRATFDLSYYPDDWKISNTVVLRKPGKPDYTDANAYRPIALLNCIAKILSACVAAILVHETETRALLPNGHILGRPGRTTTDSLHLITTTIKNEWRKGNVSTTLFLDVKAAFPNANPDVLIHNMRKRGIPLILTGWLRRRLDNRKTNLVFDDFSSQHPLDIINGIDQGCPLSVILYQFYNADLLDIAKDLPSILVVANIDDVAATSSGPDFEAAHENIKRYYTRAKVWSDSHSSPFSLPKLAIVNHSRRSKRNDPPIQLSDVRIEPAKSYKFLGVLLDGPLRFHDHVNYALAKGQAWIQRFRRLARPSQGIRGKMVRMLYLGIAVPSMLYAADIFLSPLRKGTNPKRAKGSVGHIRHLARVQRAAAIMITGGMWSSPTDVLDNHAELLPFHLLVDKICHRATVRMATLPPSHPLSTHIRRAAMRYVRRHRTSLHELFHLYNILPEHTETIQSTRQAPGWIPDFRTQIAISKEEAKKQEEVWATRPGVRVYSDGSDIDGGVGAAAVLYRQGKRGYPKILKLHLGASSGHTVYEAEIVGMILGMELIRKESHPGQSSIAVDNQPALRAAVKRYRKPGHYLLDKFLDRLRLTRNTKRDLVLTLRWVPGHVDIEGNETADVAAKEAARGSSSAINKIPANLRQRGTNLTLPTSAAKLKQLHLDKLKLLAISVWKNSKRYNRVRLTATTLPAKYFTKLVDKLPRKHASVLFQLRSGHAPLRRHLHRIGKAQSPICPACHSAHETVFHFLIKCPAHRNHRVDLFREVGLKRRNIVYLLSNKDAVHPLFRFIHESGRLASVFGGLILPDELR